MDRLRDEFDAMYDNFANQQNILVRKSIVRKREEIWNAFNRIVRPYYADALHWRRHCTELRQKERLDCLAGGKFEENA